MTEIKLVVFDMDGTLLEPRSCWAYIHDYFGTDNSDMLKRYIERKISDQDFVKADFKLWQDSTEDNVNEIQKRQMIKNIFILLFIIFFLSSCGKKGDPKYKDPEETTKIEKILIITV